jgi:Domain of unknown function (DUF397)
MSDKRDSISWKKSSYSMSNGQCVETARLNAGQIGVRDSRAQEMGPTLRFTATAWAAFTATVQAM